MTKDTKSMLEGYIARLNGYTQEWEDFRTQGSTDLTYDVTCSIKILEARAELKGIINTLKCMGYNVVKGAENKHENTLFEIVEINS